MAGMASHEYDSEGPRPRSIHQHYKKYFRIGAISAGAAILTGTAIVGVVATVKSGVDAHHPPRISLSRTAVTHVPPAQFANVDWANVPLPGWSEIPPGMGATSTCGMSALATSSGSGRLVYYLTGFSPGPLAVVPAQCQHLNQSPLTFFLFKSTAGTQPKLFEVLYEGNFGAQVLDTSVPVASLAATTPEGWSGLFYWNGLTAPQGSVGKDAGLAVARNELYLSGKVIPKGGQPPIPSFSTKGLVGTRYIYQWLDGRFRFMKATEGVTPVVP